MKVTMREVRAYLSAKASKKELVYYTELYHHFKVPKEKYTSGENPIPVFLGTIMRDDAKAGYPLLPSIVVAKKLDMEKSKLLPNQTYFTTLAEVRNIPIPAGRAKRPLYAAELQAVFDYYAL